MFDIFWKRKPLTEYPAYLGHTVYQSEYDALKEECNGAHETAARLSREFEQVRKYLEPFRVLDSGPGNDEHNSTVELARYVNSLLKSDTAIIQQQAREIEQLTEQLDNRETIYDLAVAQIREMQAELDALRQQQIMLSTTTPTNKRKPRVTGAKP